MTKEISLTQGKVVIVDDDDYEWLSKYKWQFHNGYARRVQRLNGKQICFYMHREILNPPNGLLTDHVNGNKLDNRRENLRPATKKQNNTNKRPFENRSSRFKGVSWSNIHVAWVSRIKVGKKYVFIGAFEKEEDAANAYNIFAMKHQREYAYLNDVPLNHNWRDKKLYKIRGRSRYRGVAWCKAANKWQASITINSKQKYLGVFENEKEAAKAYNEAALFYRGEQSILNKIEGNENNVGSA